MAILGVRGRMQFSRFMNGSVVALSAISFLACTPSKDSDSAASTTSAISLSGTLSAQASGLSLKQIEYGNVSLQSVNLGSYSVKCSTATTPPLEGTGTVSSNGTFTISIAGAAGQPLSCYLLDANGDKAADFIIADSSKKDLNGNDQTSGSTAFKTNANLGAITFDPDAGEVTVPAANIASSVKTVDTSAVTVFDPTGEWTITAADFTLPSGVESVCESDNEECNGPPAGASIYLKRFQGSRTSDASTVFALQVWQGKNSTGEAAFQSCGSKVGLSSAAATALGVDFSTNGSSNGAFGFASSVANFEDEISSVTGNVTLTDNWKMNTAVTQYSMYPCSSESVTIGAKAYAAYRCGPDANSRYQLSLEGGCKDSSQTPVNVSDWSGMSCNLSNDVNGIRTNTCTGTVLIGSTNTAVTCTNSFAIVDVNNAVDTDLTHDYDWNSITPIAPSTLCSDGSLSALQAVQCYADYYRQSGMSQSDSCLPRVDTDWTAATAADFVKVNFRPNALVFMDEYKPFPDGSGGSILTREEQWRGVQVTANNWVNCRVIETGSLSVKKISSTKLLATYQSSSVTTTKAKPACVANFSGVKETFMFYLLK